MAYTRRSGPTPEAAPTDTEPEADGTARDRQLRSIAAQLGSWRALCAEHSPARFAGRPEAPEVPPPALAGVA
jgi:hypothetical protein